MIVVAVFCSRQPFIHPLQRSWRSRGGSGWRRGLGEPPALSRLYGGTALRTLLHHGVELTLKSVRTFSWNQTRTLVIMGSLVRPAETSKWIRTFAQLHLPEATGPLEWCQEPFCRDLRGKVEP